VHTETAFTPTLIADPGLLVLVAEDVPASRMLLQAMLQRAGHRVIAVADGALALAALRGAQFDAGLLDLDMPGLGGLETAAAIRRLPGADAALPLVAVTADERAVAEAPCRAAGFDAVLTKPFEARQLLALLESTRRLRRPVSAPAAA
jgi:CheY-like chemotaxis protein